MFYSDIIMWCVLKFCGLFVCLMLFCYVVIVLILFVLIVVFICFVKCVGSLLIDLILLCWSSVV